MKLRRENLKYKEQIKKFVLTLKEHFSDEDLELFYKNIVTLRISQPKYLLSFFRKYDAYYKAIENEIGLGRDINDIFHELFHLASTYIDEEIHCGFSINRIGCAINEGYTEVLTKRYFNNIGTGYYRQIKYASFTEEVIGKDIMEKLYLHANFFGLIDELAKYSSISEAYKFIENMDKDYKKYPLTTTIEEKEMIEFLLKCYINKEKQLYINEDITFDEYKTNVFNFAFNINNRYNNQTIITRELLESIINTPIVKKKVLN